MTHRYGPDGRTADQVAECLVYTVSPRLDLEIAKAKRYADQMPLVKDEAWFRADERREALEYARYLIDYHAYGCDCK